jgi:hypothetical protein
MYAEAADVLINAVPLNLDLYPYDKLSFGERNQYSTAASYATHHHWQWLIRPRVNCIRLWTIGLLPHRGVWPESLARA